VTALLVLVRGGALQIDNQNNSNLGSLLIEATLRCTCIYTYIAPIHINIYTCIYMCIFMHVCMDERCMCRYIYICIHTHTHTVVDVFFWNGNDLFLECCPGTINYFLNSY